MLEQFSATDDQAPAPELATQSLAAARDAVLKAGQLAWRRAWIWGGSALGYAELPDGRSLDEAREAAERVADELRHAVKCARSHIELQQELNRRWDYAAFHIGAAASMIIAFSDSLGSPA